VKALPIPTPPIMNWFIWIYFFCTTSSNIRCSFFIFWNNEWNSWVGIIWSWSSILVESEIVETHIHGLTIYPLQMLYGSTLVQSVIFCEENLISTLENLSIHMLMSFLLLIQELVILCFPNLLCMQYHYQNDI